MRTILYAAMIAAIFSSCAMAESEETHYFKLQCEQEKDKLPCDLYKISKEDEKLPDNKRNRLIGLDEAYPVLIDKKTGLQGRFVSAKRKYNQEEKNKHINITDKEYRETSELQLTEKRGNYRFDVAGKPKDKNNNVIEAIYSTDDYVYLYLRTENTSDKYDRSENYYSYFIFDRKYKSLMEVFDFRGNRPRQDKKTSDPMLYKKGDNYYFKWAGVLDGDKVNIFYTLRFLPNSHYNCIAAWDESCEGIQILPRKQ